MNSKIVEKIQKLLNLSKSGNEHEAANAAAMASELMARHQISVAELEDKDDIDDTIGISVIDSFGKKVVWKGDLAFGVAESFGCRYYWNGANPMLVGHKSNVDSVKYVYQYLVREVNRLAEESWEAYPRKWAEHARSYKTSFRKMAAMVIRRRLKASRQENLSKAREQYAETAIVKVENRDQAVVDYYKNLSKGWNTFKPSGYVTSAAGRIAGRAAGEKIRLGGGGPGLGTGARGSLGAAAKLLGK